MQIIFFILGGAVLAYLVVIFPVWMMIKCVRSQTSLIWKIVWMGLMLGLFGLGSYLYAFFGSEDMNDHFFASVIFTVIIFTYLLILPLQHKSLDYLKKNLLFQIGEVERSGLPRVDPVYAVYLRENLNILKMEIRYCHFWELNKQIQSTLLVLSLKRMMDDKEFSLAEYMEWMNQFKSRQDVAMRELKEPFLKWKPFIMRLVGMETSVPQGLNSSNVAKTLKPDPNYPFIGFWKEDCSRNYGLAINKAYSRFYTVTFCGPAQCIEPEQYRPDTTIENDPNYQVIDAKTIRVKGSFGFETYHRCSP